MISIVVPAYNSEKYISDTLESIFNNDYQDYELIIIDDGSSDNTYSICQKYQQKDKRIKLYKQDNKGVSYSRNKGISLASGEYIAFIDSDDTISKDYFSKLLNYLLNTDSDWVTCKIKQGKLIKVFNRNTIIDKDLLTVLKQKIFFQANGNNLFSVVGGLIKKDILLDNNLCFCEDINYGEDTLFNYQLIHHINRYAFLNENMYFCSINDESLSNNIDDQFMDRIFKLFKKIELYRKNCKEKITLQQSYFYFRQILAILSKYIFPINDKEERLKKYLLLEEMFNKYELDEIIQSFKNVDKVDLYSILIRLFVHKKYELLYKLWYFKNYQFLN